MCKYVLAHNFACSIRIELAFRALFFTCVTHQAILHTYGHIHIILASKVSMRTLENPANICKYRNINVRVYVSSTLLLGAHEYVYMCIYRYVCAKFYTLFSA